MTDPADTLNPLEGQAVPWTPGPWRSVDDRPPHEQRPFRQWIFVEGDQEHHGRVWRRERIGEAVIRREGDGDERQGYRRSDIEAIEQAGDMDPGTGIVLWWIPVVFPPVPSRAALSKARGEPQ